MILDTLYLIGRQPQVIQGESSFVWCLSPDVSDYEIRKLSLKTEGAMYKLLVEETASPIMHNAWFSTLMANVLYGKLISYKQSVCYLNKATDSPRFVRASFRQVSKLGAPVRITFAWGDGSVEYSGAVGEDLAGLVASCLNYDLVSRPGQLNSIKINTSPEMSGYEINAVCEHVVYVLL